MLVGQPNTDRLELDNPIEVPDVLSFLTYKRWKAEVKGLKDFPQNVWPDNIPLLYYALLHVFDVIRNRVDRGAGDGEKDHLDLRQDFTGAIKSILVKRYFR